MADQGARRAALNPQSSCAPHDESPCSFVLFVSFVVSPQLPLPWTWAAEILSSSPGESHPQALTEPYVNLSIHTALLP